MNVQDCPRCSLSLKDVMMKTYSENPAGTLLFALLMLISVTFVTELKASLFFPVVALEERTIDLSGLPIEQNTLIASKNKSYEYTAHHDIPKEIKRNIKSASAKDTND